MKAYKLFDTFLNKITMYRLLVYGLLVLIALSVVLAFSGSLSLSGMGILADFAVLMVSCFVANVALPVLWNGTANHESGIITGLILCCILPPSTSAHDLFLVALAGMLAIASKYVIALYHKHIFNPAAAAAMIVGISGLLPATWWIGSPALLPATIIFGILILHKIRRFQLFFSFLVASLIVAVIVGLMHSQLFGSILLSAVRSSPLIFMGSVMLTEPETTPPGIWHQRLYGLIVGALFMSQLRVGIVSATPELALVVGNLYAYLVSPKRKLQLHLQQIRQLARGVYDLSFIGAPKLAFEPGQYLEWTLGNVAVDQRGNRRTFSIASAPEENEIHIGIKTYDHGSSFKKALVSLQPGAPIIAGSLSGNFTLPKDTAQKLVFVAGGIGVTPFVSMAKHMTLKKQHRDVSLIYIVADPNEYCYQEIWKAAKPYGLNVIPVLSHEIPGSDWQGLTGRLTSELLTAQVPDFKQRQFYLSGPNGLVTSYKALLTSLGIARRNIKTDHFSGY
jgi:ferredoxin-NADP reductase/Na+-translocating ferredoxin:NAD+ oxidoreductase RnfD subunit